MVKAKWIPGVFTKRLRSAPGWRKLRANMRSSLSDMEVDKEYIAEARRRWRRM